MTSLSDVNESYELARTSNSLYERGIPLTTLQAAMGLDEGCIEGVRETAEDRGHRDRECWRVSPVRRGKGSCVDREVNLRPD